MDSTEVVVSEQGNTFGFLCPLKRSLELNPKAKLTPTRLSAPMELQLIDGRFRVVDEIRTQSTGFRKSVFDTLQKQRDPMSLEQRLFTKIRLRPFEWNLPKIAVNEMILVCDRLSWQTKIKPLLGKCRTLPKAIILVNPLPLDSSFLERTENSDLLREDIQHQLLTVEIPNGQLKYADVAPTLADHTSTLYQFRSSEAEIPRAFVLQGDQIVVIPQENASTAR
jgi:hypothetical protein